MKTVAGEGKKKREFFGGPAEGGPVGSSGGFGVWGLGFGAKTEKKKKSKMRKKKKEKENQRRKKQKKTETEQTPFICSISCVSFLLFLSKTSHHHSTQRMRSDQRPMYPISAMASHNAGFSSITPTLDSVTEDLSEAHPHRVGVQILSADRGADEYSSVSDSCWGGEREDIGMGALPRPPSGQGLCSSLANPC